EVFADSANGGMHSYEARSIPPPDSLRTFEDIAHHGEQVRARYAAWWRGKPDHSGRDTVQTYYGPQTLHETMERATWHSGQHVRQWVMLLEREGLSPVGAPKPEVFAGLPMPVNAWDG